MENMWIFYSLAGLLVLGLGDFIKKVVIQKGGNKDVFLFVCFVIYLFIFGLNYLINGTTNFSQTEIQSALVIGLFDFLAPMGMLTALKYLEISFSLVSIRLVSSLFILVIGMNILGDSLSIFNLIGFFIGFIAIYLLSGFSFSNRVATLHWKGVVGVIMAIVGVVGGHSYFKYSVESINVDNFMFLKFGITGLLLTIYMILRKKFQDFNLKQFKITFPFAIVTGIIFSIQFLYLLPQIYLLGTLSLGYKILSYSLIVPIILSIIIYKDKITPKKLLLLL